MVMRAPSIQLPGQLLYLLLVGGIGLGFVLAFGLVRDSRPPRAPSGLVAQREGDEVVLTWQDQSDDETGFLVERRVAEFSGWEEAGTVGPNVTHFRETPPSTAGQYSYYRVRGYKDRPRLYSPLSEEVNPILLKPPLSPTRATPTPTSTPEPPSLPLTVLTPAAVAQPSPMPVVKQRGLPALVDPHELFVISAVGGEPVLLYRSLQPVNVVWSPLGTALAFGNKNETYVVTLPPGRGPELLHHISQSVGPVTWSPDGARFAFSAPEGVYVANLAGEMALVGPVEGTVREMLWSPLGDLLAVATLTGANEWKWKVLSMSPQTGSPGVELYAGDRGSRFLAWLPGTSRLLAAERGKLLTIDLVTQAVSAQDVPLDATVFASPNGSAVALMESGDICPEGPRATSLALLRLTDSSRTEILKGVCGLSGGVTWSPDGRGLAYGIGLGEERGIYVADVVAGRARRLSEGAQKDGNFGDKTWLPDSSGLVVTEVLGSGSGSGICPPERYVFVPVHAGSPRVLFTTNGGCIPHAFFGGFAPDSRRYLYASEGVWVGDLGGEAKALIEPDPSYDYGILKWSPAGDRVAFLRASSHLPRRYSVNLNTGEITRQAGEFSGIPSAYRELTPQPSPDGRATAFWREIEGGRAVTLYVEESGRERLLARFGADAYRLTAVYRKPVWSPEGRRLAIFVGGAGPSISDGIYVVETDGSGLMEVVATASYPRIYSDLAWSADGQHILFSFLGIVCC